MVLCFGFFFKVEAKRCYPHPQPPGYDLPLESENKRELSPKEIKSKMAKCSEDERTEESEMY